MREREVAADQMNKSIKKSNPTIMIKIKIEIKIKIKMK